MRKIISIALAAAMALSSMTAVFAKAPSDYDGKSYTDLGYTSDDPDGQINLAVIANGDVTLGYNGSKMYIDGSVYSGGTVYKVKGQGDQVHGLLISGTDTTGQYGYIFDESWNKTDEKVNVEGYKVLDNGNVVTQDDLSYYSLFSTDTKYYEDFTTWGTANASYYAGAIKDDDTPFECKYEKFTVDTTDYVNAGDTTMSVYYNDQYVWDSTTKTTITKPDGTEPKTVTTDTAYGTVTMNGTQENYRNLDSALIIDTTSGDVNVVIDTLSMNNPSIKVVGTNRANIYIKNVGYINNLMLNYDGYLGEDMGSSANTYLYLDAGSSDVTLANGVIKAKEIYVNTTGALKVSGSADVYADIYSGASAFTLTGGSTEIYGTVCVPNAASEVIGSGVLYGQLHTNTLAIGGSGAIVYKEDSAVVVAETTPTAEPTATPTAEPTTAPAATEEPAAEPTEEPYVPSGSEIDLSSVRHAYIFGDEPKAWEDGETAVIYMAPERAVQLDEVCAMITRLIIQVNEDEVTGNLKELDENWYDSDTDSSWYGQGMQYLNGKGYFATGESSDPFSNPTREQVAKLIVFGLNLSGTDGAATFSDVPDDNAYKTYIDIMSSHGYMEGDNKGNFDPDKEMTRAEFCAMFNNITARNDYLLETAPGTDENGDAVAGKEVTTATYYIVDVDYDAWYYKDILRATSAFTKEGYVDLGTRQANIRNISDNYEEGQKQY